MIQQPDSWERRELAKDLANILLGISTLEDFNAHARKYGLEVRRVNRQDGSTRFVCIERKTGKGFDYFDFSAVEFSDFSEDE